MNIGELKVISFNTCKYGELSKNIKTKIYRTVILPVGLYGCETWYLTLRKEHRLRVFENRVLRKIFGPERDEVTSEWRKLHSEELYGLYCSLSIWVIKLRIMRLEEGCNTCGKERGAYRVLMGKPETKRPLGRPRYKWNIIFRWIM